MFNTVKHLQLTLIIQHFFVFGESSETPCKGRRGKEWGRAGLRGLPAFVQQVKWPDSEKAAEKLILVHRDPALIREKKEKKEKEAGSASRPPMQQFPSFHPESVRRYNELSQDKIQTL